MKKLTLKHAKLLLILLGVAGVSRAIMLIIGLAIGTTNEPHFLKALSVSPLPRVFDRNHYFAERSLLVQRANGETTELSESQFLNRFASPWHYRILPRHMLLFGAKKNPPKFDAFIRHSLCTERSILSITVVWDYWGLNAALPWRSNLEKQTRTVECL